MLKKLFLIISIILVFSAKGYASDFKIDPNYSEISVHLPHEVGFNTGFMEKFSGKLVVDERKKTLKGLDLSVDATSLNTFNPTRDASLQSENFFDSARYPAIEMKLNRIEQENLFVNVTFRGMTKEIPFEYFFLGVGKTKNGTSKASLVLKGLINREDFGVQYNKQGDHGKDLLGDIIEVTLNLQGNK